MSSTALPNVAFSKPANTFTRALGECSVALIIHATNGNIAIADAAKTSRVTFRCEVFECDCHGNEDQRPFIERAPPLDPDGTVIEQRKIVIGLSIGLHCLP